MSTTVIASYPTQQVTRISSFEAVCLFCAAGFALSAAIVSALPAEAVVWALANIG
jgi:hypothetical protein